MPRFDRSGPLGSGPQTGRGFGPCGSAFGYGRNCRGGYGYGRFISPKNELAALEEEEKILEEELKIIREEKEALKNRQK